MFRHPHVRRWYALALLLAACAASALLPSSNRVASAPSAFLFVSPNTRDGLDVATARRLIDTPDHARYRRLAGDVLTELGVRERRVCDALGEWGGSAENSLCITIHEPIADTTIRCAAAWCGLAARQKAVLVFRVGDGDHVLAIIDLPRASLATMRDLLDRHGFPERTLIARGDGWRAVVLAESRHRRALQCLPGARVCAGRAVLIGAPTADGARERYREVIRAHHAAEVPLVKLGW